MEDDKNSTIKNEKVSNIDSFDRICNHLGNIENVNGIAQQVTETCNIRKELEENLDFTNTLLEALSSPIFFKDTDLVYRRCNKAFEEYLNIPRDKIINKTAYDISPKEAADIYYKADMELLESKGSQKYESILESKDGTIHNVIFNKSVVFNKEGLVIGIIGIINDITERVKAEGEKQRLINMKEAVVDIVHAIMEVKDLNSLFEIALIKIVSAIQHADLGCIVVVDSENNLSLISSEGHLTSAYHEINLYDTLAFKAMNSNFEKCIYINNIDDFAANNGYSVPEFFINNEIKSFLCTPVLKNGLLQALIYVESKSLDAFDEMDLSLMEYVRVQLTQVISKQMLYEENKYLARHDFLTTLYNRRYFNTLFELTCINALKENKKFHLVLIDLNNFKRINDQFGHLVGDEVLRDFASRIKTFSKESDIFARYGGDEFIFILFNVEIEDVIVKFKELGCELLKEPLELSNSSLAYSFSYGIAQFPIDGTSFDELIHKADGNMYMNKDIKHWEECK